MPRKTTIQVLRTADKSNVETDSLSTGEFLFDTTSKSLYIGTGTTVYDAVKLNATSGDEIVIKSLSISTSNGVIPKVIDASSDNKSRVKAQYVNATTINATTLNASIVKIGATTNHQYLIIDKTQTDGQLKIGALTVESTDVEISNLNVTGALTLNSDNVATEGYVSGSTSTYTGTGIKTIKGLKIGATSYNIPGVQVTSNATAYGNIKFLGGTNVTLATSDGGNTITINAAGGGGTSGVSSIGGYQGAVLLGAGLRTLSNNTIDVAPASDGGIVIDSGGLKVDTNIVPTLNQGVLSLNGITIGQGYDGSWGQGGINCPTVNAATVNATTVNANSITIPSSSSFGLTVKEIYGYGTGDAAAKITLSSGKGVLEEQTGSRPNMWYYDGCYTTIDASQIANVGRFVKVLNSSLTGISATGISTGTILTTTVTGIPGQMAVYSSVSSSLDGQFTSYVYICSCVTSISGTTYYMWSRV